MAWDAAVEFTQERRAELAGLLWLAFAAAMLLALVPREPNLLGLVGAGVFRALFGLFGLAAYGLPFVAGAWGWSRLLKQTVRAPGVKAAGLVAALLATTALLHLIYPPQIREGAFAGFYLGGLLGRAFGGLLVEYTAPAGTLVISLALLGAALYLLEKESLVKNAFLHLYERARIGWMEWRARPTRTAPPEAAPEESAEEADRRLREVAEKAVRKRRPLTPPPSKAGEEESPPLMSQADRDRAAEAFLRRRQEIKISAGGPRVNTLASTEAIHAQAAGQPATSYADYKFPPVDLLRRLEGELAAPRDYQEISANLERSLASFGVSAKVVEVCPGPTVTRYEIALAPGVKMSRVTTLADDIALSAKVSAVRIEGPIPGKGTLGVEIPNAKPSPVSLRELVETDEFQKSSHKLIFAVGKDIGGSMIFSNLAEMPHLLVAGTTGSGKSVCLNAVITSILFRAAPDEVRFLLIDPKRVELTPYDGLPHLIRPVVTNPKEAAGALRLMVEEMEERYKKLAAAGMRKIDDYNEWVAEREREREGLPEMSEAELAALPKEPPLQRLPFIVVVVDELADLMMVSANEVESSIARLAQMARGVGIHLVIATQRPSVDVITGIIKANLPSRIAFQVSSKVDSRTILDASGADALLGRGDMLYAPYNVSKPVRVQGCFISSAEVAKVVAHIKSQAGPVYDPRFTSIPEARESGRGDKDFSDVDEDIYEEAVRVVLRANQGSTSVLQRRLRIGYGKAARLLDKMEAEGIIGPPDGNRPRKVLINPQDYSIEPPEKEKKEAEQAAEETSA